MQTELVAESFPRQCGPELAPHLQTSSQSLQEESDTTCLLSARLSQRTDRSQVDRSQPSSTLVSCSLIDRCRGEVAFDAIVFVSHSLLFVRSPLRDGLLSRVGGSHLLQSAKRSHLQIEVKKGSCEKLQIGSQITLQKKEVANHWISHAVRTSNLGGLLSDQKRNNYGIMTPFTCVSSLDHSRSSLKQDTLFETLPNSHQPNLGCDSPILDSADSKWVFHPKIDANVQSLASRIEASLAPISNSSQESEEHSEKRYFKTSRRILQERPHRLLGQECHKDCLTCTGPGNKMCSTCPSGRELSSSGSCDLIVNAPLAKPTNNQTQPVAPEQSAPTSDQNNCPTAYMPFRGLTCIPCFSFLDFNVNHDDCTTGEFHRYCDWNAKVTWVSGSQTAIIIEFQFLEIEKVKFQSVSSVLQVTSIDLSDRHVVKVNGSATAFSSRSGDWVQVHLPISVIQAGADLRIEIENSGELKKNVLWENSTSALILVQKKVTVVLLGTHSRSSLNPGLTSAGTGIQSVGRVSAVGYSALSIGGSVCSFNFSVGLVKLFQIIEILGKFYFLPVGFSPLTDYFLELIFGISDIITTDPSMIVGSQLESAHWNGKLSSSRQEKQLLRSMPLMMIMYLAVLVIDECAQLFLRNSNPSDRIKKLVKRVTASVRFITLQMNLVDLVFYSGYALAGPWFPLSPMLYFNKLAASLIMIESVRFLNSIVFMATTMKRSGKNTCQHSIMSSIIFEGIKKKAPAATVRNLNSFFVYRLIFFQVTVVCLQNSPGTCVFLLCATQAVFALHFVYVWARYSPFESAVAFLEKLSFEVCISIFLLNVCLTYFKKSNAIFDIFVICMVLVCIMMQVVSIFYGLNRYLRNKMHKLKQSKSIRAKHLTRKTYLPSMRKTIPSKKITQMNPTPDENFKHKSQAEFPSSRSIRKDKLLLPFGKRSQRTTTSIQNKLLVRAPSYGDNTRHIFPPSIIQFPANRTVTNRKNRLIMHKTVIETSNETCNDLPLTSFRQSRLQDLPRK